MSSKKKTKKSNGSELLLEGKLTLDEVADIKKNIVGKIISNSLSKIILTDVTSIDASILQLIYSTKKYFQLQNLPLQIEFNIDPSTRKYFELADCSDLLK